MSPVPVVRRIDDGGRPWKFLPRCEATVSEMTRRWRTRSGRDDRCDFNARYCVDGRNLCIRHAGMVLVETLCEEEETP